MTTNDFKALNGDGLRVFISNLSKYRVRISISRGENMRTYRDGELVYQREFRYWNNIPAEALQEAYAACGKEMPEGD